MLYSQPFNDNDSSSLQNKGLCISLRLPSMGSAANSRMVALKGPLIHTYVGMAADAAQPSNDASEGENAPRPGTTDI